VFLNRAHLVQSSLDEQAKFFSRGILRERDFFSFYWIKKLKSEGVPRGKPPSSFRLVAKAIRVTLAYLGRHGFGRKKKTLISRLPLDSCERPFSCGVDHRTIVVVVFWLRSDPRKSKQFSLVCDSPQKTNQIHFSFEEV
jgi:hypothetical protein